MSGFEGGSPVGGSVVVLMSRQAGSAAGAGAGAGNHTLTAEEAFRQGFNVQIWQMLKVTPSQGQIFVAFGTIVSGILLSLIMTNTVRYYHHFGHKDSMLAQLGIAIGTLLAVTAFGMHCFQGAYDRMTDVFEIDALCNWSYVLLGGIYALAALIFYAFRIWKLSGRKWWIVPGLAVLLLVRTGMMLWSVVLGLEIPHLTAESAHLLPAYFQRVFSAARIWAAVSLTTDSVISLTTIFFLLYTKNSVMPPSAERNVLHRIVLIILESLLPPVILKIVMIVLSYTPGGYFGPMRVLLNALPLTFYYCLLFSLIGRHKVRTLLDRRSATHNPQDASYRYPWTSASDPPLSIVGRLTGSTAVARSGGGGEGDVKLSNGIRSGAASRAGPGTGKSHDGHGDGGDFEGEGGVERGSGGVGETIPLESIGLGMMKKTTKSKADNDSSCFDELGRMESAGASKVSLLRETSRAAGNLISSLRSDKKDHDKKKKEKERGSVEGVHRTHIGRDRGDGGGYGDVEESPDLPVVTHASSLIFESTKSKSSIGAESGASGKEDDWTGGERGIFNDDSPSNMSRSISLSRSATARPSRISVPLSSLPARDNNTKETNSTAQGQPHSPYPLTSLSWSGHPTATGTATSSSISDVPGSRPRSVQSVSYAFASHKSGRGAGYGLEDGYRA